MSICSHSKSFWAVYYPELSWDCWKAAGSCCCMRLALLAAVSIFPTASLINPSIYPHHPSPVALYALVLVLWGRSVSAQLLGLLKATQAEASRVRMEA